jgi:alkylation response protein AidB-like acyl-CoA dehydrogenase
LPTSPPTSALAAPVWYAAHAFDRIRDSRPATPPSSKPIWAISSKRVARDTTELHGGIGFTWEFDLHLWFRRALFDRSFMGESNYHRERAADLAGW